MGDETSALADRQSIAALLARHSIAIDNADADALRATYSDDGAVAYGFFTGPAATFSGLVTAPKRGQPRSLHRTSNIWLKLAGDTALSESCVVACNTAQAEGQVTRRIVGGRYLDRLVRTAAGWRIAHRTYVLDWNLNHADRPLPPLTAGPAATPLRASAPQAGDLADRAALRDLGHAWCRAMDRSDAALLAATGLDAAFDPAVTRSLHAVSDERFAIAGERATGTCRLLVLETRGGEERVAMMDCTDRFTRTPQGWRFAGRDTVPRSDYRGPSTEQFGRGIYEKLTLHGRRDRDDPVYAFWGAG
jgi:ketosteroid isomerase-like protein